MSEKMKQIEVGCIAEVKVGRNLIKAPVCEILPEGGYIVQSASTGKKFKVGSLVRVVASRKEIESKSEDPIEKTPTAPETIAIATAPIHGPGVDEPADEEAPESGKPVKKLSFLDAAVEVLKTSGQPMNTREIVKAATDSGLWIPTACRTPEQTLYGSIFREIATKEQPRIVKAEQKGKFEFAG